MASRPAGRDTWLLRRTNRCTPFKGTCRSDGHSRKRKTIRLTADATGNMKWDEIGEEIVMEETGGSGHATAQSTSMRREEGDLSGRPGEPVFVHG